MSNEKFTWAHVANVTVCPKLVWVKNTKKRLKFKGIFYSKPCSKFIYCLWISFMTIKDKNFINFWIDMSSSVHIDNKGKDILILNKGPTEGLNHMLTAEAEYSINFYKTRYNILFNPAL